MGSSVSSIPVLSLMFIVLIEFSQKKGELHVNVC